MADQPPDIQSAALLAKRIEAARATMLGLALGDSWSAVQGGRRPAPAGVATQLACATVEGTTRAMERAGHNLSPEWGHATYGSLVRWAAHQGISGVCPGGSRMTDGWLESVPALAERRGNAPSTVAALQAGTSGLQPATNQSMGSHGMVRTLPLGLLPVQLGPWMLPEIGAVAATTHGHPLAHASAMTGAALVWAAEVNPNPVAEMLTQVLEDVVPQVTGLTDRAKSAVTTAVVEPADAGRLKVLAPDRTAVSTLSAAVYAMVSFPEPEELPRALSLASQAPDSRGAAAVAGAVLGTRHRTGPLIAAGAALLELAFVCTTLATDLVMELMLTPLGLQPDGTDWINGWRQRYPVG